jgi:hypothetical protein
MRLGAGIGDGRGNTCGTAWEEYVRCSSGKKIYGFASMVNHFSCCTAWEESLRCSRGNKYGRSFLMLYSVAGVSQMFTGQQVW